MKPAGLGGCAEIFLFGTFCPRSLKGTVRNLWIAALFQAPAWFRPVSINSFSGAPYRRCRGNLQSIVNKKTARPVFWRPPFFCFLCMLLLPGIIGDLTVAKGDEIFGKILGKGKNRLPGYGGAALGQPGAADIDGRGEIRLSIDIEK